MPQYTVRSGQNIYDVALTLYGSVEGIFYLLAQNKWLDLDTTLTSGQKLEYSEELAINNDIVIWLRENNIKCKNGQHSVLSLESESFMAEHFNEYHLEEIDRLATLSPDETEMFWETLTVPRLILKQQGVICNFKIQLNNNTHILIDWGDNTAPSIFEGDELQEIEHNYKSNGQHIIVLYGDFSFQYLDFTELNGTYYPLTTIYADTFISQQQDERNNKLIIPQE